MNSEQRFKPGDVVYAKFGNGVIRGKFKEYSKLIKTFCYVDFESSDDHLYEFTQTLYEDELFLTKMDALCGLNYVKEKHIKDSPYHKTYFALDQSDYDKLVEMGYFDKTNAENRAEANANHRGVPMYVLHTLSKFEPATNDK